MTKVKRTYALLERDLPYILSPSNAIRILRHEYGRCRRTVISPDPSQERFRTGTFDIPIVSSHDIESGKVVALEFHPQHYVVDSNGKVRSALPHQLEIRARKLLGQPRSEVVYQSDAAVLEVQELMKDPYPIHIPPASSPTNTSQGPLPVKKALPGTQEEQSGFLQDIGDTAGAGALILAGGIADRLGFDEVADNAFGAATELLEKPGSSGAKEEAVAVLGTTLGAAKTVGDTLIGGAQLARMAAQEKAYDLLGGEQGLGRHIDSLQSNHENMEQIKASAGQAVKAFAQDIPGSLGKGAEAAGGAVDNFLSNVDSVANTDSNVQRLLDSSEIGETAANTVGMLTGAAGLVRGGTKAATKAVGSVTDDGAVDRMKVGIVVPNKALVSPAEVNWKTSRALGMEISDPRDYAVGQQMFESLQQAGVSPDRALRMSRDMLESGVDLPSTVSLKQGDQLFKLVPTGSPPSGSTPYFVTGDVLERLPNNPQTIGEMLGLPQVPSSFELYSITAKSNVDVFQSQIAKFSVNSGEHLRSGGEIKALVTRRDLFTEAKPLNRYITGQ